MYLLHEWDYSTRNAQPQLELNSANVEQVNPSIYGRRQIYLNMTTRATVPQLILPLFLKVIFFVLNVSVNSKINRVGGAMIRVRALSAVGRRVESSLVSPKTMKLAFVASLLSTQHEGERAVTSWLGIRIMYPKWSNLSIRELLFQGARNINIHINVLVKYKVDIIIILSNITCSSHDIAVKLLTWL